jgi:tRNA (guanine37-N1)-methyltransferase
MKYTFITLFSDLISFYFKESILNRAVQSGAISVEYKNPRDFSTNRHHKTDAPLCGGGAGQLMTIEPLDNLLESMQNQDMHIVFLQPSGKKFTQNDAKALSLKKHIVFVCGRYEGIDERVVEKWADEIYSIGDFILTGGELASLCICDAVSRNINTVLGNSDSLDEESFNDTLLEAPSFAKPIEYKNQKVPDVLIGGNHSKIEKFKKKLSILKTKFHRPDLYSKLDHIDLE